MKAARFWWRARELALAVVIVALVVVLGALIAHDAHAAELAPASHVRTLVAVVVLFAGLGVVVLVAAVYTWSRDPLNAELDRSSMQRVRFECTCGWHGTRELAHRPNSMTCPRCNGVAISMRART